MGGEIILGRRRKNKPAYFEQRIEGDIKLRSIIDNTTPPVAKSLMRIMGFLLCNVPGVGDWKEPFSIFLESEKHCKRVKPAFPSLSDLLVVKDSN
jgi:hypothetical protein